jgi:hypothetical protein
MNKKIILLLFLSFLIFSCREKDEYYALTDEEKSLFPYDVGDIVRCKNIENDTIQYILDSSSLRYELRGRKRIFGIGDFYEQVLKLYFSSGDSSFLNVEMSSSLSGYKARIHIDYEFKEELLINLYKFDRIEDSLLINNESYDNVYIYHNLLKIDGLYLKPEKGILKIDTVLVFLY